MQDESGVLPALQLNKPVVAVDFDDTIHDAKGAFTDVPHGPPLPGTLRALTLLHHEYQIHIYTARDTRRVWGWLVKHDMRHLITSVTNRKPKGHIALFDNAAIPIPQGLLPAVTSWLEAAQYRAVKG